MASKYVIQIIVVFTTVEFTGGAYHLTKISEYSGWNTNGKVTSRKFHPKFLE